MEYAQRQVCVLFGRRSAYIILCAHRTLRFSPVWGGGAPYLIFALGNYGILWRFRCGQSLFTLFNILKIPIYCNSFIQTTQKPNFSALQHA